MATLGVVDRRGSAQPVQWWFGQALESWDGSGNTRRDRRGGNT